MYKGKFWDLSNIDIERFNFVEHQPDMVDSWGHSITSEYCQRWESGAQYAYNVLMGLRKAGNAEIAMCERFFYDLHRNDLRFDTEEIELVLTVANELRHPKGPIGGQRIFLMRWMILVLSNQFGFYYNDKARESLRGARRFLKTVLYVARGNAKTTLAAVVGIINSLFTDNTSPVCTTSATTSKQSRLAFEDISKMVNGSSQSIRKRFRVLQNEIRVIPNGGKIIPTSKQASSLDGIRVVTGILDEIHAHPDSEICDVIETGTRSSKDPIILMISTAGFDTQSFGREVFDYSKEVACRIVENDRYFAAVYCPNDSDLDCWDSPEVWEMANPSLNHSVSLEGLRAACVEAKRNASARANFLTKHCNIFVDFTENSFISSAELMQCRNNSLNISDYHGRECYLGLDLAGVSDLSSLVYVFPEDDGSVTVFQKAYLPEDAVTDCKASIQDRYHCAVKNGELILTVGNVTDFQYIENDIVNAYHDFDVRAFSIDGAAGGVRFAGDLYDRHQIEAVSVKQGFGLSEAAVLTKSLIKSGKFKYKDNLLEWCFTNALEVEGSMGDIKIVRPTDRTKKIDVCIATLIAISQTVLKDNSNSIYETQDIRFL
ncbi:terminase large subunit [Plesiomonas shigelloides]|uniref:terminase large subunit n=1 Tax=Plesiomonas shigelloides TaxID=703 RepID=UPI00387EE9AA